MGIIWGSMDQVVADLVALGSSTPDLVTLFLRWGGQGDENAAGEGAHRRGEEEKRRVLCVRLWEPWEEDKGLETGEARRHIKI